MEMQAVSRRKMLLTRQREDGRGVACCAALEVRQRVRAVAAAKESCRDSSALSRAMPSACSMCSPWTARPCTIQQRHGSVMHK